MHEINGKLKLRGKVIFWNGISIETIGVKCKNMSLKNRVIGQQKMECDMGQ